MTSKSVWYGLMAVGIAFGAVACGGRTDGGVESESIGDASQALEWDSWAANQTDFTGDHGFSFRNSSTLKNEGTVFGSLSVQTEALCGGLSFTALDYFHQGKRSPNQWYAPASGTLLREFITGRQIDSISQHNLEMWANYLGDVSRSGTAWHSEFPKILREIDKGHPVVLGVKATDSTLPPNRLHQVIVAGYELKGYDFLDSSRTRPRLMVLDPNTPEQLLSMRWVESQGGHFAYEDVVKRGGVPVLDSAGNTTPVNDSSWDGFFVQEYSPHIPPVIPDSPVYAEDGLVHDLIVRFVNSGDDLRRNSRLDVTVRLVDGTKWDFKNVNGSDLWPGDRTKPGHENVRLTLPKPVPLADLFTMSIQHKWLNLDLFSGGVETDDNYDTQVKVFATVGATKSLITVPRYADVDGYRQPSNVWNLLGSQAHRFEGPDRTLTFNLQLHEGYVNKLSFREKGGATSCSYSDGLMANDRLTVSVELTDSSISIRPDASGSKYLSGCSPGEFDVYLDRLVKPCELGSFGLNLKGGWQQGTNYSPSTLPTWSINHLEIWQDLGSAWSQAYSSSQGFTLGGEPYRWTFYPRDSGLACSDPVAGNPVNRLNLRLWASSVDGLRGHENSDNLNVTLKYDDGSTEYWGNINNSVEIPNGSEFNEELPFGRAGIDVCHLKSIELYENNENQVGAESCDNFGVVELRISAEGYGLDVFPLLHSREEFWFSCDKNRWTFELDPPACPSTWTPPPPFPMQPVVCSPGDPDYCYNNGVCDVYGYGCECQDDQHFFSSEQCRYWHNTTPTVHGNVCSPGDQSYCGWMGVCSADGLGCVCKDPQHLWSSEQCLIWHETPAMGGGDWCTPGSRADCGWRGICDNYGTSCLCNDPDHWTSDDHCQVWHASTTPPATGTACTPGDNASCWSNGVCPPGGATCICNDPHFWATENCQTWHQTPELAPAQLCYPGDQSYCHWMGVCDPAGLHCVCFDPTHWYSSEQCASYH